MANDTKEKRRIERHKANRGVKKVRGAKKKEPPISSVLPNRRSRIHEGIDHLIGTTVSCPCLGGVPVEITRKSIKETAEHAAKGILSMEASKNLVHYIETAKFYKMHLPKDNTTQTDTFGILFMYELHAKSGSKRIKIMVGVRRKSNGFVHYSITV